MSGVLRRRRVWVVDDSALDAERACRALGAQYELEAFHDGSAMLEHLSRHPPPDVLVLDWVMPGVSGIEVCRFLRGGDARVPHLCILLLTTRSATDQIVEGLSAGANDYLGKPYADAELVARVDALIRSRALVERAEAAEATVRKLLELAPDALVSTDAQGCVSFANAEAVRILGRSAAELKGVLMSELLPALSPALPEGVDAEEPLTTPDVTLDGDTFSPTVRRLSIDGIITTTIALRNVTARRRQDRRRLDFYSMIAHDLRSPLGAMLLRTALILRGKHGVIPEKVAADVQKIESSLRNHVALINDFLDLAQMENASDVIEREALELESLVTEVIEEFRPLVDAGQQAMRTAFEGACGATVLGDRRRIHQVLANLIGNAVKFTPAGGTITASLNGAGDSIEVAVTDDGPGIAPSALPTLFDRYTRAPDLRKHVAGTGLGLMIVREIVEAHAGTFGVDSQPGRGSRFWFRLPRYVSISASIPVPVPVPVPAPAPAPA